MVHIFKADVKFAHVILSLYYQSRVRLSYRIKGVDSCYAYWGVQAPPMSAGLLSTRYIHNIPSHLSRAERINVKYMIETIV